MNPGELRDLVAARTPVDAREAGSIAVFLREIARLDRPCDEHTDPVHVTASAIVVGPRGTVLHLHKRLGMWLQPGGHIDPVGDRWEEPWEAALREAAEETGLAVSHPADGPRFVHLDVHPGPKGHTHLDLRYLIEGDGDPAPGADESPDVRWFGWDEALALADAGLRGALLALRP